MSLVERTETIRVPKGTGREGFLRAVGNILKLPNVREVIIDARGQVTYRRMAHPNEQQAIDTDFETILPYALIRNHDVREISVPPNAALAVALLFRQVTLDRLFPVAFVGGRASEVWDWHKATTHVELPITDELYGFPFLTDELVESSTLLLCAATVREAAMIDLERSYKITMARSST